MRLFQSFQLARDQRRNHRAILRQLVFPPANGQVTAKWLAVVEVRADNRCLDVSAWFHWTPGRASEGTPSFCGFAISNGSSRTTPCPKSNTTRKYRRKLPPRIPFC